MNLLGGMIQGGSRLVEWVLRGDRVVKPIVLGQAVGVGFDCDPDILGNGLKEAPNLWLSGL